MDKVRKEIVLKEIKYWKEHRLLPEHYCNFLLSLYTEGSATEQQVYEKKSFSFKHLMVQILKLYLVLQLPLTIAIIYFTEMSFVLQTIIFTFFVLVCLGSVVYLYKNKPLFFHIAIIVGVLILFLASVHTISLTFDKNQIALLIIILTNCILWGGLGYILKLKYLIISGIAGALILISYNFI